MPAYDRAMAAIQSRRAFGFTPEWDAREGVRLEGTIPSFDLLNETRRLLRGRALSELSPFVLRARCVAFLAAEVDRRAGVTSEGDTLTLTLAKVAEGSESPNPVPDALRLLGADNTAPSDADLVQASALIMLDIDQQGG